MKKLLIIVMVVMSAIMCGSLKTNAAVIAEPEIMPCYNNTKTANVSLNIITSGKATIKITCAGINSTTSQITAVTHLQRKVGVIWVKVDNGLADKKWTDIVNGVAMNKTHTLQLEKTGTYRVKTEFTVKGSGGANDVINVAATVVY